MLSRDTVLMFLAGVVAGVLFNGGLVLGILLAFHDGGNSAPPRKPLPPYSPSLALAEAYWYSIFTLGHLVTRSGMGIQLIPPEGTLQQMMEMAELSQAPANPYLLLAPYRSGDPSFANPFNGDENDFSNFRWDQAKMDRNVNPQALAYTMVKAVIWAKSFASGVEGGTPINHFNALVLSTEAAAQAQFAVNNLKTAEGLFTHAWNDGQVTDSTIAPQDQLAMLWAFSELADYATGKYGWYAAPLSEEEARNLADSLFFAIEDYSVGNPNFLDSLPTRDLGTALGVFSSFADYSPEGVARARVIESLLPSLASELISRTDERGMLVPSGGFSQVVTQAAAIRGLVLAYRVSEDESYKTAALQNWAYMDTLWDKESGLYIPSPGDRKYVYTAMDAGDVVGAFNALLNGLDVDVEQRFADFFNAVVNVSGLQIAEGPATGGGRDGDSIPDLFDAGGEFGRAPVLATEVVYDPSLGQWRVTNPQFTTNLALWADNQFMFIGYWGGQPSFPGHGIPGARTPTETPTSIPATPTTTPEHAHALFASKGCAACHGQDGEGSAIAPALAGHSQQMVKRQVRNPRFQMPAFSKEQISDEELEAIAQYIANLEGDDHAHPETIDLATAVALHHWMALESLKAGDQADAIHHVRHIIDLLEEGEDQHRMEAILDSLLAGETHDPEHEIEEMLAGTAIPDLTLTQLHLQQALVALAVEDVADTQHHVAHFQDLAGPDKVDRVREILDLLGQGNLDEAEREIQELLEDREHED